MADGLERMWAAWRGDYVAGIGEPGEAEGEGQGQGQSTTRCPLCGASDPEGPQAEWIIHRGRSCSVILNAFPYTSGHVLVLVNRHVASLEALTEDEADELWRLVRVSHRAISAAYAPDGANIGANLGTAAGAGVPDHLHLHVLPRWMADTSFVTAVAGMRVLPEALDETAAKLRAVWPADLPGGGRGEADGS